MEKESRQELRNSMIRGLVKVSVRASELIEKNYPEIAKKIRAKDVPLEEIVSDLKRVMRFHVTKEGMTIYIEASKEGEI